MVSSSAFYFKFYEPQYNPTGLSGDVGGLITTTEIQPKLGILLADMQVPEITTQHQYRKIWIKQTAVGTFNDVSIRLANVEHTGQIAIATGSIEDVANANALTAPTGLYGTLVATGFSGDVNNPLYVGNTTLNSTVPIWVRETIASGAGDDAAATFVLQIQGTKIV
jgi:hypothetical protein